MPDGPTNAALMNMLLTENSWGSIGKQQYQGGDRFVRLPPEVQRNKRTHQIFLREQHPVDYTVARTVFYIIGNP